MRRRRRRCRLFSRPAREKERWRLFSIFPEKLHAPRGNKGGTRSGVVSLFGVKIDHKQRGESTRRHHPASLLFCRRSLQQWERIFIFRCARRRVFRICRLLSLSWLEDKSRHTFSNGWISAVLKSVLRHVSLFNPSSFRAQCGFGILLPITHSRQARFSRQTGTLINFAADG